MDGKLTSYSNLIDELELWTRKAMPDQVSKAFDELTISKIPRSLLFKFAHLAQRNSRPELALGILNSVVRGKLSEISPAEDFEILAYASSLNQMECNDEALELLEKLDAKKNPKIDFSMAMALAGLWKYKTSIVHLKRYIRHPQTGSYEKAIGKINLLSAYIQTLSIEEAFPLSAELDLELVQEGFSLLHGNAWELKAQLQFLKGEYQESLKSLEKAESLIGPSGGIYIVFVKKWQFLSKLFILQKLTPQLKAELESLHAEARKYSLWEVLRDIDFFVSLQQKDSDKILSVLSATPNSFYQNRARKVCQLFGLTLPPDQTKKFVYRSPSLISEKQLALPMIELQDELFRKLTKTPVLFALLKSMLEDSYRPCGLAKLGRRLYPEMKFEPKTILRRVQTVINRLNQFFIKNKLPIKVRSQGFEFFLEFLDESTGAIQLNPYWMEEGVAYGLVRSFFKGRRFTIDDFQKVSGFSKLTARRELEALSEAGALHKKKSGSSWAFWLSNFRDL